MNATVLTRNGNRTGVTGMAFMNLTVSSSTRTELSSPCPTTAGDRHVPRRPPRCIIHGGTRSVNCILAGYHVERARAAYRDCIASAPSQPRLPPATFNPPTTPFEAIVADFFHCVGQHYLVVADRLSAWPEVFQCTPGSPMSGAEGLISCRNYSAHFGVPTELSSDGGDG